MLQLALSPCLFTSPKADIGNRIEKLCGHEQDSPILGYEEAVTLNIILLYIFPFHVHSGINCLGLHVSCANKEYVIHITSTPQHIHSETELLVKQKTSLIR